jgi:hypothetical protein
MGVKYGKEECEDRRNPLATAFVSSAAPLNTHKPDRVIRRGGSLTGRHRGSVDLAGGDVSPIEQDLP